MPASAQIPLNYNVKVKVRNLILPTVLVYKMNNNVKTLVIHYKFKILKLVLVVAIQALLHQHFAMQDNYQKAVSVTVRQIIFVAVSLMKKLALVLLLRRVLVILALMEIIPRIQAPVNVPVRFHQETVILFRPSAVAVAVAVIKQ